MLTMALATLSNNVMAEWTRIISDRYGAVFFVDLSAIRENGSIVEMWDLTDFKINQKSARGVFLSRITEGEYNCKEKRERVLVETKYLGHMGNGDVVYSGTYHNPHWEPVLPGTVGDVLWKAACKKRINPK
jgi:hypothetical protein